MTTLKEVLAEWQRRLDTEPELRNLVVDCVRCHERVIGGAIVLKPAEGSLVAETSLGTMHAACAVDAQNAGEIES